MSKNAEQTQLTVSVITVCRNSLAMLKKTVENVLSQTYTNLELIVIDGASDDGTQNYLQRLSDNRLRWISEPDDGIYDAMNKAVGMCSGAWSIFMNAGDTFYNPDVICRVFSKSITADVIYGNINKDGKGEVVAERSHNAHRMYFCHQAAFTQTELLRKYPFDTNHKMSADFKLFKQLYLDGYKFLKMPLIVANYDTTGVSNTNRAAGIRDNIAVVKEVDSPIWQIRLLPRLYFQLLMCRIRSHRFNSTPSDNK